jgi:hypothetical protein
MDKPEATTEADRLRRELETVRGGSEIKSERLYEMADKIADLTAKLAEAEQSLEYERMRLAACSTAALGYFEDCVPEYRSAALEDILALRATNSELRAEVARLIREAITDASSIGLLEDDLKIEKQSREAAEARLTALREDVEEVIEDEGFHITTSGADRLIAALAKSADALASIDRPAAS